jgi:DNA-binding MarR family transcriptional regulator
MKLEEILDNYNDNNLSREQAIFTSLFVIQNRLQTACEKIQNELSMKQWLLLTIVSVCPTPHTLTNIGRMMGCSRQNVKKLVSILEAKDYIEIVKGNNNSVCIELTDKVNEYSNEIGFKQIKILELLFKDFSEEETKLFFNMIKKMYSGLKRIEEYVGEDNE